MLFGFLFGLFFGFYGFILSIGFVLGVEMTQAAYRSFSDGYKWKDLYKNPFVLVKYLKAKKGGYFDTVLDVAFTLIGSLIGMFFRKLLGGEL